MAAGAVVAHPADKYANATQPWMRYQPRRDTLTAHKPTMAERIPIAVKDALRALGLNKFAANAFGTPIADVLGYSPVGAVAQSWDAGQAAARADTVGGKAGALGGGVLDAMLNTVPGGPAAHAMFLGIGAKLGDKAGMAAVRKAAQMKAAGIPREQILKETGWFQGVDKKWRFEVDDSGASSDIHAALNDIYGRKSPQPGDNAPIDQMISHRALFAADPVARDTKMAFLDRGRMQGASAAYAPKSNIVTLSTDSDPAQHLSDALHEMQHAAQQRHGFAQGGSGQDFTQQADAQLARDALSWRRDLLRTRQEMPNADWIAVENATVKKYQDIDAMDWIPSREARDIAADFSGNPDKNLIDIVSLYALDRRTTPLSPREAYHRLAGEVEARNVQKRMGMSAQERIYNPPWATQDVPDLEQIIRRHVSGGATNWSDPTQY